MEMSIHFKLNYPGLCVEAVLISESSQAPFSAYRHQNFGCKNEHQIYLLEYILNIVSAPRQSTRLHFFCLLKHAQNTFLKLDR